MTRAEQGRGKRKRVTRAAQSGRLGKAHAPSYALAGSSFVARFMDKGGVVDVDRVADAFRMSKGQLAQTAGLGIASVSKADNAWRPGADADDGNAGDHQPRSRLGRRRSAGHGLVPVAAYPGARRTHARSSVKAGRATR